MANVSDVFSPSAVRKDQTATRASVKTSPFRDRLKNVDCLCQIGAVRHCGHDDQSAFAGCRPPLYPRSLAPSVRRSGSFRRLARKQRRRSANHPADSGRCIHGCRLVGYTDVGRQFKRSVDFANADPALSCPDKTLIEQQPQRERLPYPHPVRRKSVHRSVRIQKYLILRRFCCLRAQ